MSKLLLSCSRNHATFEPEQSGQAADHSQGKRGKFAQSRNTPAIRIEVDQ